MNIFTQVKAVLKFRTFQNNPMEVLGAYVIDDTKNGAKYFALLWKTPKKYVH